MSAQAAEIVRVASQPDASVHVLAEVARRDPTLALRVLGMANSPAFSRSEHRIHDIGRAAAMVGVRGMRNLALSLVITGLAPEGPRGRVLLMNALRRAVAAKALAEHLRGVEADAAFTLGLFLDAGLLVHGGEDIEGASSIAMAPANHRIVREQASGWIPHPEVGATLARTHGVPEETWRAIASHHDAAPPEGPLARIGWLAERVAAAFEGGRVDEVVRCAHASAARVGVPKNALAEVFERVPPQMSEMAESLGHALAESPSLEEIAGDAHRALVDLNHQYEQLVVALESALTDRDELTAQLRAANEELQRLTHADPLTGIANKRALEELLVRELASAARAARPLSLIMVDIDHFKQVNDTYGHATGDDALRMVGEVLRAGVRAGDLAARYGGEEFAVVLSNTEAEPAMAIAERLRKAIALRSVPTPRGRLRVTASFGVACVTQRSDRDALFRRADEALYSSKRNGRDRVTLAPPA
ncbi:MAG: diguanylate cyclase [Sandaracinaceae bacterium]